jgi:type IV secretory pathway component VirB8
MKAAKTIYAENITWEQSAALREVQTRKWLKIAAVTGWGIAILNTLSTAPLMHFQHVVPTVIVVDKQSGDYHVEHGNHALTVGDTPDSQQRFISDLGRYVRAREGFSRGEADINYKTVWLMSAPELRGLWDAYYKPDLNKQAPLNIMQASDTWKLSNFSFTFLPTSEPDVHVAQVRYDLTKQAGQLPPTMQRMVSTITFKYSPANTPVDTDDYTLNAFGFEATNYRRDEDGLVRQVTPAAVQQQSNNYVPQPSYPTQTAAAPEQYPQPVQIAAANRGMPASLKQGFSNLIGSKGNNQ